MRQNVSSTHRAAFPPIKHYPSLPDAKAGKECIEQVVGIGLADNAADFGRRRAYFVRRHGEIHRRRRTAKRLGGTNEQLFLPRRHVRAAFLVATGRLRSEPFGNRGLERLQTFTRLCRYIKVINAIKALKAVKALKG